ncbi:unnamed protein product [Diabrotica balteata]|uniref:Pre-mRNA-splicing factor 38 n=1 Tax=Diabrotica balteata TaxID=107213 RepID=A0A9N9XHA3_DIABA|nr:unnamed protein product [Diabrotica balteata]
MDQKGGNSDDESAPAKTSKQNNVLPLWGNERTMNLNPLILTNIQSSHYFKVNLYELKTYHEVVDEIYYKVSHLEPWEKGSRRTSGQTGMCGGVRGVGAGGIVSTAYCLLYKLFTLKLTRKQLNGLISHCDSPYIRALGFMYIRYTFPPANLLEWYEDYLEDEEELDVKAGGGQNMTMGLMLRQWLVKLDWFSTLFPRIPVPIQQKIQKHLEDNTIKTDEFRPINILSPIEKLLKLVEIDTNTPDHGAARKRSQNSHKGRKVLLFELDNDKCLVVVFLDLKRAFEAIDHNILLTKLECYGIGGNVLEWIKDYLLDRKQQAR